MESSLYENWDETEMLFGHLVIGNLQLVIGIRQLAINNWLLAEGNRSIRKTLRTPLSWHIGWFWESFQNKSCSKYPPRPHWNVKCSQEPYMSSTDPLGRLWVPPYFDALYSICLNKMEQKIQPSSSIASECLCFLFLMNFQYFSESPLLSFTFLLHSFNHAWDTMANRWEQLPGVEFFFSPKSLIKTVEVLIVRLVGP